MSWFGLIVVGGFWLGLFCGCFGLVWVFCCCCFGVVFFVLFGLVWVFFILSNLFFKIPGYEGQLVVKDVVHHMYGCYCRLYNFLAHSYCSKLSDYLYVLSAGD